MPVPVPVLYWLSLVLGCLASIPMAYFGMNYIKPGPLNTAFKDFYNHIIGPYMGWKGDILRSVVGPSMLIAGLGIEVALWGTCLNLFTGELGAWANGLLLCALHGMCVILGSAAAIELSIGNIASFVPAIVLFSLFVTSYVCRMLITPISAPQRLFYWGFVILTIILMLVSLILRLVSGIPLADAKKLVSDPDGWAKKLGDALEGKEAGSTDAAGEPLTKA